MRHLMIAVALATIAIPAAAQAGGTAGRGSIYLSRAEAARLDACRRKMGAAHMAKDPTCRPMMRPNPDMMRPRPSAGRGR